MNVSVEQSTLSERYMAFLQLWARVQYELLSVFWAIMEVALIMPGLFALMPWARYWVPGQALLWMLVLMLFAFNLTRLLSVLQLDADRQRTLNAIALFLTVFLSIRSLVHEPASLFDLRWIGQFVADVAEPGNLRWAQDASLFVVVVLMWYRGIRLVNRDFGINRIGLRLRVGGLLIAPMIVWLGNRRLLWDVTPMLLLFFLAGLTAVSLIRAEQLEQDRSKQSATLDPRWLLFVFLGSLLTILTAGLLTAIVSGRSAGAIVGRLAPVVVSIQYLLAVALGTLFFVAIPFLEILDTIVLFLADWLSALWLWLIKTFTVVEKILSKLVPTEVAPTQETPTGFGLDQEGIIPQGLNVGNLSDVSNILTILLMIAVILIVALLVGGVYRRVQFAGKEQVPVLQQASTSAKEDDGLLSRVLRRLGFLRHLRTAVSIRRVYRNMLNAADASGFPRLESETPYEYLHALAQAWPLHQSETKLITRAYVNVRYGEIPETEAELNAILSAWKRLEEAPPDWGENE